MNRRATFFLVVASLPSALFADPVANGPVSRYAAERRYNELADQSAAVQKELTALAAHMQVLETAQKKLKAIQLSDATAATAVRDLQDAFRVLDGLAPTVPLNPGHQAIATLLHARGEVFSYESSVDSSLDGVRPVPRLFSSVPIDPVVEPIKSSVNTDEKQDAVELPNALEHLDSLLSSLKSQGFIKKEEIPASSWTSARAEVAALSIDVVRRAFNAYKESKMKYLAAMVTRFKSEIDGRNTKLRDLSKALNELDKSLQDEKQQQGALDRSLVWAVYGMIGALTVLFLSLKFFNSNVAEKVVENRSLVEVMSMAFMLLTIIILGTGGRIGQETLGTLLGTIAGYIFGRKMSEATQSTPKPQVVYLTSDRQPTKPEEPLAAPVVEPVVS